MVSATYSTAFLQVAYRPNLSQLTGCWLASVSETELHIGYDALRQAALHYRCGGWLGDSRRRPDRSLHGRAWVTDHFLPQVQRQLRSPLCVCFLVLPDYLQRLPPGATAGRPAAAVEFARVLDEGAAHAWLARRQVDVPV